MGVSVSLYKIADVLQIPLLYDGKRITGGRKAAWQSKVGLCIPMQLSAEAIFFSSQVGVVAHIIGNLYMLVAHNPEKGGLSAYLIDNSKLTSTLGVLISKKMNLREVVESLGKSVVRGFYNSNGIWKPLALPK